MPRDLGSAGDVAQDRADTRQFKNGGEAHFGLPRLLFSLLLPAHIMLSSRQVAER